MGLPNLDEEFGIGYRRSDRNDLFLFSYVKKTSCSMNV